MAQVSHSTSQLHMATAFHFLRENILSPPDLEPALPECEERTQGSSPSSTSAMAAAQNGDADAGRGGGRYGGSSPTIFDESIHEDLSEYRTLHSSLILLQYVDDLLVAAETKQQCLKGTQDLLQALGNMGY